MLSSQMSNASILLILVSVFINSSASLLLKKGASALTDGSLRELAASQGFFKAAAPALNIYTVSGMILLVISFVVFLVILSKVNVSVAQPMLALSYVVITVGAFFFYGEPLSPHKILGIAIIIIGVTILSQSAQ